MAKRLGISVAVLTLNLTAQAVCPIPQYELCRAEDVGTDRYLNCLARNRQEDARYQQCQEQERRERQERERERREREQEKYCQEHPDAPECK